jgi:hypothetical protein
MLSGLALLHVPHCFRSMQVGSRASDDATLGAIVQRARIDSRYPPRPATPWQSRTPTNSLVHSVSRVLQPHEALCMRVASLFTRIAQKRCFMTCWWTSSSTSSRVTVMSRLPPSRRCAPRSTKVPELPVGNSLIVSVRDPCEDLARISEMLNGEHAMLNGEYAGQGNLCHKTLDVLLLYRPWCRDNIKRKREREREILLTSV